MVEAVAVQIERRHGCARGSPTHPHRSTWSGPRRPPTEMLAALGLPIDTADMFETPRRLVHAYAEMLTPPEFDSTTFENAAGYDELVLVSDIPVHSLCEHHLLPFTGVAHVGYLPSDAYPRAVEVRPDRGVLRPSGTDPGAADHGDRRAPHRAARAPGRRRRDRGRAHLHEPARGAGRGRPHRDRRPARAAARRPETRAEFLSLTRDRRGAPDERPDRPRRRRTGHRHARSRELRAQGYDGDLVVIAGETTRRTSGRRCPRATCSATSRPRRRWSTPRAGTPSTTSTCAPA